MDYEGLAKIVKQYRTLCEEYDRNFRIPISASELPAAEREIHAMEPKVLRIAEEFSQGMPADYKRHPPNPSGDAPYARASEACTKLIGALESKEGLDKMFEPSGPKLVASNLHPWVWNVAVILWDDGHYRHAVHDAYEAVEKQVALKVGSKQTGNGIWERSFTPNPPEEGKPRLRLREFAEGTKDWRSIHLAAITLGQGCSGLRGLGAHTTDQLGEQEALERLAAMSFLARIVEKAEVERAT